MKFLAVFEDKVIRKFVNEEAITENFARNREESETESDCDSQLTSSGSSVSSLLDLLSIEFSSSTHETFGMFVQNRSLQNT